MDYAFFTTNMRAKAFSIWIIPVVVSAYLTCRTFTPFPQEIDSLWLYSMILTWLSAYGWITIAVYIVYVFLILHRYSMDIHLILRHPDRCAGASAFGDMALLIYTILFFSAVCQVVTMVTGGGGFERALNEALENGVLYLWFLFPLALFFIFEILIYRPHVQMNCRKQELLTRQSDRFMKAYEQMEDHLDVTIDSEKNDIDHTGKEESSLLEELNRLEENYESINVWPVSSRSLRVFVIFNPLLPIVAPVLTELVRRLVQ